MGVIVLKISGWGGEGGGGWEGAKIYGFMVANCVLRLRYHIALKFCDHKTDDLRPPNDNFEYKRPLNKLIDQFR